MHEGRHDGALVPLLSCGVEREVKRRCGDAQRVLAWLRRKHANRARPRDRAVALEEDDAAFLRPVGQSRELPKRMGAATRRVESNVDSASCGRAQRRGRRANFAREHLARLARRARARRCPLSLRRLQPAVSGNPEQDRRCERA